MISRSLRSSLVAALAVAVTMLTLDMVWLGVVARSIYDVALGELKRPDVVLAPALLFYAMYIAAITLYAVIGSDTRRGAIGRGAALGLVAYATYDLTNWAIVRGWPAMIVPIDIAWGVALTATAALVGKIVHLRFRSGPKR